MDRSRVQEYAERLQNSEGSSPGFSQQLAWAWLERDARVAELEAELQSIADAKYATWDDGYNTPQDFVAWVQNRCSFLLKH